LSKVIASGKNGWPTAHDQHIHFKDFTFRHSGRIAEIGL